jgi:hypothetical protein
MVIPMQTHGIILQPIVQFHKQYYPVITFINVSAVQDLDQTDDLSELSEDEPLTPQDLEPAPLPKTSVQKASPLVQSSDHIGQGEQTKW